MANIIRGDDSTFNALTMGEMHPNTMNFLQSQIEAPTTMLTEQGQQFFNHTRDLYDRFKESRSMRLINAARRAVGSIWQRNEIRQLETIEDFQWAPQKMQRFIMAEPEVRRLYHAQRVEGYTGTYRDAYAGDVGEHHYDYRRATNGFVFVNEDPADDEPEWTAVTYYDDLDEGDRPLELDEQTDVILSMKQVVNLIRQGKDDPTSRYNASL